MNKPLQDWLGGFLGEIGAIAGTVHLCEHGGLRLAAAVNIPEAVQQVVALGPSRKGKGGLGIGARRAGNDVQSERRPLWKRAPRSEGGECAGGRCVADPESPRPHYCGGWRGFRRRKGDRRKRVEGPRGSRLLADATHSPAL